jgi:hypothetical protein
MFMISLQVEKPDISCNAACEPIRLTPWFWHRQISTRRPMALQGVFMLCAQANLIPDRLLWFNPFIHAGIRGL